jgi:hypothetical protein
MWPSGGLSPVFLNTSRGFFAKSKLISKRGENKDRKRVLTILLYQFGHGIGHINKVVKSESKTGNWEIWILNAEELGEFILILEWYRLVNVIAEELTLVAFVFVVKLGYSNNGR